MDMQSQKIKLLSNVMDEKLYNIFRTFSLNCVVFFSRSLDGNLSDHRELGELKRALELSSRFNVSRFIYVSLTDSAKQPEGGERLPDSQEHNDLLPDTNHAVSQDIFIRSAQCLCHIWNKNERLPIVVLRLPYLFSLNSEDFWINSLLYNAAHTGIIELPETQIPADFVCWDELSGFIVKILDYWSDEVSTIDLQSNRALSYVKLAELISNEISCEVKFIPENKWLPYAMYILTGFIAGYRKSRTAEDLTAAAEDIQTLNMKYDFLSVQYERALENNVFFQKQIINQKYSFGHIYEAMRRLNVNEPESILKQALAVMEDPF